VAGRLKGPDVVIDRKGSPAGSRRSLGVRQGTVLARAAATPLPAGRQLPSRRSTLASGVIGRATTTGVVGCGQ
jgi:hypothetical protein